MCDIIASSSVRGTPWPCMSANREEIPFLGEDPVSLEVPLCKPCLDLKCKIQTKCFTSNNIHVQLDQIQRLYFIQILKYIEISSSPWKYMYFSLQKPPEVSLVGIIRLQNGGTTWYPGLTAIRFQCHKFLLYTEEQMLYFCK